MSPLSSRAWRSASTSNAVRASSGPNSSVCRHVMIVSRPNTLMNHGTPAPGSLPMPVLSERIRSDARSETDWTNARDLLAEPALGEARRDLLAVRQWEDVDVELPPLARLEREAVAHVRVNSL